MHGARARAILVAAIALVVRLAPFPLHGCRWERVATTDSIHYAHLAQRLRDTGTYTRSDAPTDFLENPWRHELFRTPGYPFVIALARACGERWIVALLLAQALMGAATVAVAHALGRRWFGDRAAFVGACLMAVDPPHAIHANMVMSDVPFALVVAGAFLLAEAHLASGRGRSLHLGGLALTLATALRPVSALLVLPLALYLLLRGARRTTVLAMVALASLFPSLWVARNFLTERYVGLSSAYAYNAKVVVEAKIEARARDVDVAVVMAERKDRAARALARLGPARWPAAIAEAGADPRFTHPLAWAQELLRSTLEMALAGERRHLLQLAGHPDGTNEVPSLSERRHDWSTLSAYVRSVPAWQTAIVVLQVGFNLALWLAAGLTLGRLARGRRLALALLFVSTMVYFALPSMVVGSGRMRLPVTFLLCLFAGAGFAREPHAEPS